MPKLQTGVSFHRNSRMNCSPLRCVLHLYACSDALLMSGSDRFSSTFQTTTELWHAWLMTLIAASTCHSCPLKYPSLILVLYVYDRFVLSTLFKHCLIMNKLKNTAVKESTMRAPVDAFLRLYWNHTESHFERESCILRSSLLHANAKLGCSGRFI
jgi:hypothetical protein